MTQSPITFKLRNWRRQHELSQAEAAARMGVARRTWHQWERAIVIPGPDHMAALHKLTGGEVEPNDFYDLSEPQPEKDAA